MATYKVIQDIEAEDKLLGPLTLRQFIYAAIVIVMGFIAFKLAVDATPLLALPFLPPIAFFGLLAAPIGKDQSSEVWLLAKIRFMLKPRKRIWDQTGIKELVTITVPKKVEHQLTDGLSQTEVKSRLQALAETIDSRGWAVKNTDVSMGAPGYYAAPGSDRLVAATSLPQEVPTYQVLPSDDMMDETASPMAQQLDNMINQSTQAHRQAIMATVQGNAPVAPPAGSQPTDYWFMDQPDTSTIPTGNAAFGGNPVIRPGADTHATKPKAADLGQAEQELLEKIHQKEHQPDYTQGHMKVISPAGSSSQQDDTASATPADNPAPAQPAKPIDPEILRLAANDDLNITTIAHEANKATQLSDDDEVVISLH